MSQDRAGELVGIVLDRRLARQVGDADQVFAEDAQARSGRHRAEIVRDGLGGLAPVPGEQRLGRPGGVHEQKIESRGGRTYSVESAEVVGEREAVGLAGLRHEIRDQQLLGRR